MNSNASEHVVVLTTSESWALLREATVGRLAVVVGDQPEIFPINFLVDHGTIAFRTAEGTKLSGSVGRRVAFEADGYDTHTGQAWSVVVKGMAREVKQLYEVVHAVDLPLHPWHAEPKARFVEIVPDVITGRRFSMLDTPLAHGERPPVHHTAPE